MTKAIKLDERYVLSQKDRVWIRYLPQSSPKDNFSAKLSPKWKGRYHIGKQLGPLNYQVVLESTAEDAKTIQMCKLKARHSTADELDIQGRQRVLDILKE